MENTASLVGRAVVGARSRHRRGCRALGIHGVEHHDGGGEEDDREQHAERVCLQIFLINSSFDKTMTMENE
jgi:hypothetical protein